MLVLRLHSRQTIIFQDKQTGKPIAQILLSERSPLDFVDLIIDALDNVVIYRKKVERKIEKIGDS